MNPLKKDVEVTLSTLDDTARGGFVQCLTCIDQYLLFAYVFLYAAGMDYASVSRSLMIFNAAVTTQAVEVYIIDNHIVEHSKVINLILVSTDLAVLLNPSTSTITIEDMDSKLLYVARLYICKHECSLFSFTTSVVTIGFSSTAWSVSEDADSVSIRVSVQNGVLGRDVTVTLSTVNGTAMCESLKPLYLNG